MICCASSTLFVYNILKLVTYHTPFAELSTLKHVRFFGPPCIKPLTKNRPNGHCGYYPVTKTWVVEIALHLIQTTRLNAYNLPHIVLTQILEDQKRILICSSLYAKCHQPFRKLNCNCDKKSVKLHSQNLPFSQILLAWTYNSVCI